MIEACDTGAGGIIHIFKDYGKYCYAHLVSRIKKEGEQPSYYYKQVDDSELSRTQTKIQKVSTR